MKIVLLVGGRSTEHDASLHSYAHVIRSFQRIEGEHELTGVIYIDREGGFHVVREAPWPVSEETLADPALAPPMTADQGLVWLAGADAFCFSLLHGSEGEDGAWQGVAEVFGLRGSFGPVLASALSMNKRLQAAVVQTLAPELNVPQTWALRPQILTEQLPGIIKELADRPIVVKPNQMGASLFTERLTEYDEARLGEMAAKIFRYDGEALVQEYIAGTEFSCGVIDVDGRAKALPVAAIETSEGFFGHEQKHLHGRSRPRIVQDSVWTNKLQRSSELLFTELSLLGWARFDYIVASEAIYFLEINSLPGLMSGSLFPLMLGAAGFDLIDLLRYVVAASGRRNERDKRLIYQIEH